MSVMCASAVQALSCKCLQIEEPCVKNGNRCVKMCEEVRGWKSRAHCVASSPLIHAGMSGAIGARSNTEPEFSFAALE